MSANLAVGSFVDADPTINGTAFLFPVPNGQWPTGHTRWKGQKMGWSPALVDRLERKPNPAVQPPFWLGPVFPPRRLASYSYPRRGGGGGLVGAGWTSGSPFTSPPLLGRPQQAPTAPALRASVRPGTRLGEWRNVQVGRRWCHRSPPLLLPLPACLPASHCLRKYTKPNARNGRFVNRVRFGHGESDLGGVV